MIGPLDRRAPRLAFARHVPARRVATRLWRRLQRRAGALARTGPADARVRDPGALPAPLFPPRAIGASHSSAGWRFTFLHRTMLFGQAIDWRPDAGQLWRMNLHYFEYLEALPFAAGLEAIDQWIAANPVTRDGALDDAWNAYALSLRVVCWMQWIARHDNELAPADRARVGTSLGEQLGWLARFPETDLGGNHLIKNIKALLWGARCFGGPDAEAWGQLGRALLQRELATQVLPDGFHYERAPAYHNQVAADLAECAQVVQDSRLSASIEAMTDAACAMSHPDGNPAQFGDTGLHMAYPAAIIARALGRPAAEPGNSLLPDAGMASFRAGNIALFAKFGVPGARSLPAHAHGDIGAFELSVGGRRCIVDQGVYEYVAGERRRVSRIAASHNLCAPDDGAMADWFGEFRCGWWPEPGIRAASVDENALHLDVAHDGFARSHGCASLRRVLRARAGEVAIADSLSDPARGNWASRMLIHPDWRVERIDGGARLDNDTHSVRLETGHDVDIEEAVWWPDMGHELPTRRIAIRVPEGAREVAFRLVTD